MSEKNTANDHESEQDLMKVNAAQEEKENEMFSVDDLFNAVRYGSPSHIAYILEKDKNLVNRSGEKGFHVQIFSIFNLQQHHRFSGIHMCSLGCKT